MTIKINQDSVVDTEYFLQPMETCPKGRLVFLKVFMGGTQKGIYSGEPHYTGWAPMPKMPPWLKELEAKRFEEMRYADTEKEA